MCLQGWQVSFMCRGQMSQLTIITMEKDSWPSAIVITFETMGSRVTPDVVVTNCAYWLPHKSYCPLLFIERDKTKEKHKSRFFYKIICAFIRIWTWDSLDQNRCVPRSFRRDLAKNGSKCYKERKTREICLHFS